MLPSITVLNVRRTRPVAPILKRPFKSLLLRGVISILVLQAHRIKFCDVLLDAFGVLKMIGFEL